jgi:hypothetical protein
MPGLRLSDRKRACVAHTRHGSAGAAGEEFQERKSLTESVAISGAAGFFKCGEVSLHATYAQHYFLSRESATIAA